MATNQLGDTQPTPIKKNQNRFLPVLLLIFCLMILGVAFMFGGLMGYRSGEREAALLETDRANTSLQTQFQLSLEDINAGRYSLARQRLEYVLALDPNYPGAVDTLSGILAIIYATATPSPLPPTITPQPTQDISPVEDIFQRALQASNDENWHAAIETIIALRREDPLYRVIEVDSLLYRALMNRGIDKITRERNLEGGIYDLALAERFGPLSTTAQNWRNLARMYLIGSSFWEVYPEQAVYYFGLAASGAPFLQDASGWTARERYRASLFHYAKQLAGRGDLCAAQEQYALALAIRGDLELEPMATNVALQCAIPTGSSLTPTTTATLTPTPSGTYIVISPTPSATIAVTLITSPTATSTSSSTPAASDTPSPTSAPTSTSTLTLVPSETPTSPP